jgi:hypothetical protein
MDTNDFLEKHKVIESYSGFTFRRLAPRMLLADGVTLSAQVSHTHYCSPRVDNAPYYGEVEIGYPSVEIPDLMEFAEDAENPTSTVYGYVPVWVLDRIIENHGGIVGTETFIKGDSGQGIPVRTLFNP